MQQRIHTVAPALTTELRLLVHFYSFNHAHYGKHCTFCTIFLKNVLISDKNVLTLFVGIGFVPLLDWYIKYTHFLRYTQEVLCLFYVFFLTVN